MRAPLVLKPLALALALCGPAIAPGAAQAQSDWIGRCNAGFYEQGSLPDCQQPYQEGLAAVLTGSASDDRGSWGYIDKQGRMAIAPAYAEAEPFQNGLAAVSQGELWGYIDRKGNWAIEPRYARATGFNAEGTALVEDDGRDVLIDRQGKAIKAFPLGTRTWGFQPGQKLASMEMPQPPRLFNAATGKAVTLPAGVMRLAAPTDGCLPAQLRGTRYSGWWGLLNADGGWAVEPRTLRSEETPMRDGGVVAVKRDGRWQFVDARGQEIGPERYSQLQFVAPGLWVARRDDRNKPLLLNGKREVLHRFASDYAGMQERDGWHFAIDDEAVLLVDPAGKLQKIAVGQGRVDVRDGQLWVSGNLPGNAAQAEAPGAGAEASAEIAAETESQAEAASVAMDAAMPAEAQIEMVATDQAQTADAAADAAMAPPAMPSPPMVAVAPAPPGGLAAAASAAAEAAGGAEISEGSLLQIYTRDGKPLLDDATLAQLRAYRVTAFGPADRARGGSARPKLPLALLNPHNYAQPMGILTPTGRIVTNAEWADMSAYDAAMPLPVRTRDDKAGAIDAEGNWTIPSRFIEIRPFRGAYAWARPPEAATRRDSVLIDARGETAAVPAAILDGAEEFDGELIHYRERDENREHRWGVWSVRDGAPVLKPVYERIEKFEDDWAKVQDQRRWGVVNRKGRWVLPAAYDSAYELEYLGNGLMLVRDTESQPRRGGYSDRAYRLVDLRTGKSSELLAEKPEKLKGGRYFGKLADSGTMLFDAHGGAVRLSDGPPARREQYGDWIYIENEEREGAIDARGELKVPALYGEFNPFFVQPEGLARAYDGSGYRVIGQDGRTVLAKRGDGTPLATMKRIVFEDDDTSASIMTDLQGAEITRIAGAYSVQHRSASEGVVPYRGDGGNGKFGFLDANGKRVVGPHFDSLGPLKNGLATAQRKQRTGKFYGYIDLTGRYAIPPLYTWAADFQEERALVRQDGFMQFIDTKGEPLATFAVVCDTVTILDHAGRIAWPRQKMGCPEADELELAPDNAKAEQP
ncbi:WG repeat-containing protein [Achromobacter denitrificans]